MLYVLAAVCGVSAAALLLVRKKIPLRAAGMAAASLAMESAETINPAMSAEALAERIQEMKNRITTEERI